MARLLARWMVEGAGTSSEPSKIKLGEKDAILFCRRLTFLSASRLCAIYPRQDPATTLPHQHASPPIPTASPRILQYECNWQPLRSE